MINFDTVKLGKKAARIDPRTLKLAKYFTTALDPAPDSTDYTGGVTDWKMLLNDQLGCCTISGAAHAEQVWSLARGGEYTLPDEAILQKYQNWCGYDPNSQLVNGVVTPYDAITDQGADEISVLNAWRKNTFWAHPLAMYADPDPTNLEHLKQAIHLFGGIYIGVQLPISVQGKSTWDVASGSDAVPGSWGGHCVFVCAYRTENGKLIFTCISWGGLIDITEDFWLYNDPTVVHTDDSDYVIGPYIDETHALVVPEFVSLKTGQTPVGLDLGQMEADVQKVAA